MDPDGSLHAWHYLLRKPVILRWAGGRITHLETVSRAPDQDRWLAPGLFDPQINGYAGIDFQSDTVTRENLLHAVRGLRAAGCTRFLIALITDEWNRLMNRLRRLRVLRSESDELQSAIAGWHIEGPFLSAEPGFHGAHQPGWMRDPRQEDISELRAMAGEDRVLLTLAPERTGALEAIACAVEQGFIVSLGHTDASSKVLRQAVAAGARAFTHLGNGCPRLLDRQDNILWRVFEIPELRVSLIPDQIHVSPPLFRLAHRVLSRDAICYTTDAMAAAGAPPGVYRLGELKLEVDPDQIVRQPGSSLFAGSALRPIEGVERAARMLGCSWQEVWPGFSTTPARLLNIEHEIAVGQPASFCVLTRTPDERLQVE